MNEQKDQGSMEFWAILELFGHNKIAGFVRSVPLGGDCMLRVDVPEITYSERVYGDPERKTQQKTIAAFTKFYSPKSVYAMTPVSEEMARAAMQSFHIEPINTFELNLPALPAAPAMASVGAVQDEPEEDDDDPNERYDAEFDETPGH